MIKELVDAIRRSWPGRFGLGVLGIIIIVSVWVVVTYPSDFGKQRWNNPVYWADHPKAAAPAWTPKFDETRFASQFTTIRDAHETENGSGKVLEYVFEAELSPRSDPESLSFSLTHIVFHGASPIVEVFLDDGEQRLFLRRTTLPGRGADEQVPVVRYVDTPLHGLLTADFSTRDRVEDFYATLRQQDKNTFTAVVRVNLADKADTVGSATFVVGGNAFGLLGTDTRGRDLIQGILFGLPVALLLGTVVAVLSTYIGAVVAGVSGYVGGRRDMFIQRIVDVWTTLPALVLLIYLAFVFGSRLLYVAIVLIIFSWTGLTIQLRPMIMQIRETGFIEMARVRGLSATRIIFLNVLPQAFPLIFANFVLMVPLAILSEAGLSFLGLGDLSIPTWGQMLERAFQTGAVHLGYWWEVLPPGLAIVILALPFPLIYLAIEPVLDPKLKNAQGGETS